MIAPRASLQSKPNLVYLACCLLAGVGLIAYLRRAGNSVPEMLGVSATLVFLESSMVFGVLAGSRWLLV